MTRKAPSSTDYRLAWFEVRAQWARSKVATTIPNWHVRETLLLVVLLVHVFGTKDGYMVRVQKMRHGGFLFFSVPTGLLQRSDNVM